MNQDELLKLENQVCFPLYVASRMLTRAYQPLLDELGVTYPQYLVLMVLWEQDGLSVNEITQKLYLNTNTVTPLLKRMEKQGILMRNRSQEDERKVMIVLSPKGKKLKEQAYCFPQELFKKMGLPQEELVTFKATLMKLISQMEESH